MSDKFTGKEERKRNSRKEDLLYRKSYCVPTNTNCSKTLEKKICFTANLAVCLQMQIIQKFEYLSR